VLLKRCVDIALSSLAVILLSPVLAGVALAVWLDSGSPVLFRQERVGLGFRRFHILKFRTMLVADGPLVTVAGDHRITRVGKLLRLAKLDELPQLWNVLRGEMSMVGPRPIVAAELSKYGAGFSLYSQALPGLTGLWQVSGRNDLDYSRRVLLDCHYIRRWSVALDLRILLRTVRVVLLGHGAY